MTGVDLLVHRRVVPVVVLDDASLAEPLAEALISGGLPLAEIMDRVGGGDSFASGLIYGLLEDADLQSAVEYGAAHGALAMTTPGDASMATLNEVLQLAGGGSARVRR